MLDVLTAADVRRQDAASEALGVSVADLMERAGFAVARAVRGMLGVTYGLRVVVVCGKGNNAGDGLVAGRWLAEWGAHVTAVPALGGELHAAAEANRRRFPGRVVAFESLERELARAGVVIDALFGVGLSRPPDGQAARAIEAMNACGAPVVAIDVPSGMNSDTGQASGPVVRADGVVTLGGLKPGLCFAQDVAGWIEVADIGVPTGLRHGAAVALEESDVRAILPVRPAGTNKRRAGNVLVIAGSRAMPGAAMLASAAAVHAGAGLTTLAASERVTAAALTRVPEITTIPLPESGEGTLDDKAVEAILARAGEFDAIAIGPGLSRHPAASDAVRAIIAGTAATGAPIVVDADAINAFAGDAVALRERGGFVVVTPHEGEASRLICVDAAEISGDRLHAAASVAQATGHAVLLKGPGTVITAPGGLTFVNTTGNRGLAQGGTGDVLTGVVAALLAQAGPDATDQERLAVVAAAAWLHGRVADMAAAIVAPHPANASMLIELLPKAIHQVFAAS